MYFVWLVKSEMSKQQEKKRKSKKGQSINPKEIVPKGLSNSTTPFVSTSMNEPITKVLQ